MAGEFLLTTFWIRVNLEAKVMRRGEMKIYYLFVIPTLTGGGAERVVSILAGELTKLGISTGIVVFYPSENEYPIEPAVKKFYLTESFEMYQTLNKLQKVRKLKKLIHQAKPDLIIPFLDHVCTMTILATIGTVYVSKVVSTVRNNPEYPENKLAGLVRNITILISAGCVVQNEGQRGFFPYLKKKMFVIPNPVNEIFLRNMKFHSTEIHSILSVGRLEDEKNFPLLFQAFAMLPNRQDKILHICGEGSQEKYLKELSYDLGIAEQVIVHGRVGNMEQMYQTADLFILSSSREGMPNALLEAMASGLPCIATDCPFGPGEMIEQGKSGILVENRNADQLTKAITWMLSHPEKASQMGKAARNRVLENWIGRQIALEWIRFGEILLGGRDNR